MLRTHAILAALAIFGAIEPLSAREFSGRAQVVDGDTITIEGVAERIRLYGIDTPEKGQTCDDASGKRYLCGSRATEFMADKIGRNGRVSCVEEDRDRYGRIVAACRTAAGMVVNAALVASGWAVEYAQYSDGRYSDEERAARSAKRGMWAGTFVEPAKWRRGERLPSEGGSKPQSASQAANGCRVKGNISGSGRIYHEPGSTSYEKTRIDVTKGERWFCSVAEAEAAGWRAPRG